MTVQTYDEFSELLEIRAVAAELYESLLTWRESERFNKYDQAALDMYEAYLKRNKR